MAKRTLGYVFPNCTQKARKDVIKQTANAVNCLENFPDKGR